MPASNNSSTEPAIHASGPVRDDSRPIEISGMGGKRKAAHEASPPGLPRLVGEVKAALREFEGCPPNLFHAVGEAAAPSPCTVGLGWEGVRTVTNWGNINSPARPANLPHEPAQPCRRSTGHGQRREE